MRQSNHWIGLALIMATALPCLGGQLQAATARKDEPSHVEPIPGSKLNRVVLKASAVERLGIETTTVRETAAARKRLVAAEVLDAAEAERVGLRTAAVGPGRTERIQVAAGVSEAPAGTGTEAGGNLPSAGASSSTMDAPRAWVRVLPIGDAPKVARDQPALVMPLIRGSRSNALPSRSVSPSGMGAHDTDPTLYYVVEGPGPALPPQMRVLIELPYQAAQRRVVPHSAVFYDEHGQAWVYTNPEPLVFIRHPIQLDYVDQDQAFLSDGPAPGAEIVKIGAAMLYGVEFGVGH